MRTVSQRKLRPILLRAGVALLALTTKASTQTVRDSAGINVVENVRPVLSAARAWRVDPAPSIRLGANAADADTLNELLLVMGVTRLSDDRFAVGVQASNTVRFYDARGRFVGSAGRRGQGPGEFRQVMGVRRIRGDTLVVTDGGEVEIFTGDGKFVRQGPSRSRGDRFVYPVVVLEDGSYLGVMYDDSRSAPPPAGRARRREPVVRVSRDGAVVDTIGSLTSSEALFDGRNVWGEAVAFSTGSVLSGDRASFFIGSPSDAEITQFELGGKTTRVIRLPNRGGKPGDQEIRDYRAWRLAMLGEDGRPMQPAMKQRIEQQLERTVYADRLPAFGNLIVDRSGNLWAQRFDYRSAFFTPGPVRTQTIPVPTRWDVLDSSGVWLCTVDLPERFTPVEIGTDYVAGVARDQDEIEQVHVYRLRKP